MVSVLVRDKYVETLNAFGDIQTAVDAALERYTIEQITTKLSALRERQKTFESKYGTDYTTFATRTAQDKAFVHDLEAKGNPMWEADLLDWEFSVKGIQEWKQRLQDLSLMIELA